MEKYKAQIKEIGLTFKKVAELIGVSNTSLSQYLSNDESRPMPLDVEDKLKEVIAKYKAVS
jgi:predicted transcriptional regulator